jgi:hypothetical protein
LLLPSGCVALLPVGPGCLLLLPKLGCLPLLPRPGYLPLLPTRGCLLLLLTLGGVLQCLLHCALQLYPLHCHPAWHLLGSLHRGLLQPQLPFVLCCLARPLLGPRLSRLLL